LQSSPHTAWGKETKEMITHTQTHTLNSFSEFAAQGFAAIPKSANSQTVWRWDGEMHKPCTVSLAVLLEMSLRSLIPACVLHKLQDCGTAFIFFLYCLIDVRFLDLCTRFT
jgi:hypothetical protein